MIRNYYLENYKSGKSVTASDTLLIDGSAKTITTVGPIANSAALTSGVTMLLGSVFADIKVGMYVTAPAGVADAWTVNDKMIVAAVSSTTTNTTVTFNKFQEADINQGLSFFTINQSSWKPYNIMIGQAPSTFTIQNNVASGGATPSLVLNAPDNRIKVGMNIGGIGITTSGTKVTNVATDGNNIMTVTVDNNINVAANASLTYSFTALNTIKILTVDNEELTITNPLENQILPVGAVQVFATGTLQVTNITAFN